MAEKKTPLRSEVAEEFKWNLDALYKSDADWEEDLKTLPEAAEELAAYAGTLAESPARLREFFDKNETFERRVSNIFCYASLLKSVDAKDEKAQVMSARAMSQIMKLAAELSFVTPEILEMPEEKLAAFEAAPELTPYQHTLDDLRRSKAHVLSKAEEKILSGMGEIRNAPGEIADMLETADLVYDSIKDEDGGELEVTGANYIPLQMSDSRAVREAAFHSYYKTYKQHINTFTATYAANVNADVFEARTRHHESALAMSLFSDNIPLSVYDSLIETVHKHLPTMYRYVALRKKMLGLSELHYYDVYAPLVKDSGISYTLDEAKQMVLDAVAPLGSEYVANVKRAYDEHWIDYYPNVGKQSGAFSSGTYDSVPYIMMNFNGTLDSVSTLAHEMGHSQHTLLANTHNPAHDADYTLFVAEIASTVNENLLIDQLIKKETDPKKKLFLLNEYMEGFKGTVFRQTMFAEFEKLAHEEVEKGGALSAEFLNNLYEGLVKQYFGPDLTMDEEVRYEWARIPHFYRSFYVYMYATGYSSAVALSEAVLNDGEEAVKKYLEFLSMGGSAYPLDELRHGGVDLSTPEPIDRALGKFERIVEEAEKTLAELERA